MRFRLRYLLSISLLILAAYGLYLVKWEVRELKRQNTLLTAEIMQEKEAIRVLEAEWAYLTRPQRLRQLADKYLELGVINGMQLADVDMLEENDQLLPVEQAGDEMLSGTHLSSARGVR